MLTTEPVSRHVLPRADLVGEIEASADRRRARADFSPERLAHIRQAAQRMGVQATATEDIRHAALLVERASAVDLGVPTASRVPGVGFVKQVLKAMMIWYLRFLGHQVQVIGEMSARLGFTVARRVEELDAKVVALEERVAALEGDAGDPRDGS